MAADDNWPKGFFDDDVPTSVHAVGLRWWHLIRRFRRWYVLRHWKAGEARAGGRFNG